MDDGVLAAAALEAMESIRHLAQEVDEHLSTRELYSVVGGLAAIMIRVEVAVRRARDATERRSRLVELTSEAGYSIEGAMNGALGNLIVAEQSLRHARTAADRALNVLAHLREAAPRLGDR